MPFFGLFAPRRNASTRPVAPTLVNGLSIASWSDKKDLAWEFIKFLMSVEVQRAFAEVGSLMVARSEVMTDTSLEIVAWLEPWYQVAPYAAPVGQLGNRGEIASVLVEALDGRISPGEAILRMAHAHQVALDRLYGGN